MLDLPLYILLKKVLLMDIMLSSNSSLKSFPKLMMFILTQELLIILWVLLIELKKILKCLLLEKEMPKDKELKITKCFLIKWPVLLAIFKELLMILDKLSSLLVQELLLLTWKFPTPWNQLMILQPDYKIEVLNVMPVKLFGKISITTSHPNFQPLLNLCTFLQIKELF